MVNYSGISTQCRFRSEMRYRWKESQVVISGCCQMSPQRPSLPNLLSYPTSLFPSNPEGQEHRMTREILAHPTAAAQIPDVSCSSAASLTQQTSKDWRSISFLEPPETPRWNFSTQTHRAWLARPQILLIQQLEAQSRDQHVPPMLATIPHLFTPFSRYPLCVTHLPHLQTKSHKNMHTKKPQNHSRNESGYACERTNSTWDPDLVGKTLFTNIWNLKGEQQQCIMLKLHLETELRTSKVLHQYDSKTVTYKILRKKHISINDNKYE